MSTKRPAASAALEGPVPLVITAEHLHQVLGLRAASLFRDDTTGRVVCFVPLQGVPAGYTLLVDGDDAFEYVWERVPTPQALLDVTGSYAAAVARVGSAAYTAAAEQLTAELRWELLGERA